MPGVAERTWYLPDSVNLKGPAPNRFGITINRYARDTYRVRVLWNRLCLTWDELSRVQIMTSLLAPILNALGTDLWYLLNQPVEESTTAVLQYARGDRARRARGLQTVLPAVRSLDKIGEPSVASENAKCPTN